MPEPTSPATAQFDALYLALRRRLLLQCFALTGDLSAARAGVRDAFIAARRQWRRIAALEQPEAWIRQRAMNGAQRHHVPHRRRIESGLSEHQADVLRCLGELKDADRRALVLFSLGGLPPATVGRDLAITEAAAQRRIATSGQAFAQARGCSIDHIGEELRVLAPIVTHPGLPRAHAITHRAQRRTRIQTGLGVIAAIGAVSLAGLLVTPTQRSEALAAIEARPLTHSALVTSTQLNQAMPGSMWQEIDTSTNTSGTGIQDACQRMRFADPNPAVSLMRKLSSTTATAIQRTEISVGVAAARTTYATTLTWYADCSQTQMHLISASRLKGVGDQAWLLRLDTAIKPARTYEILVTRVGMITSTLVLSAPSDQGLTLPDDSVAANLGQAMVRHLCDASAAGVCPRVAAARTIDAVPPTVESRGMLAAVDLPAVPKIQRPWVGTRPVFGGPNLAATTCDATTFNNARTRARTFVIPLAGLPQSFGLTETIATYPTTATATAAAAKIRSQMATCHHRQIGTIVDQQRSLAANSLAPAIEIWHEQAQINSQSELVTYWMGITQRGRVLAQITMIPAPNADLNTTTFLALVERAAQRLTQQ